MLWLLVVLVLIAALFGGLGNAGTWGWSPLGIVLLILIIWLFTRGRGNGPVI